jgi:DNA mismatch repair ATPase MutS
MSSRVRVGNLSPAKQQKIIANVRAGQAAFNQLKANLRLEEQLMNNIEKLTRERAKVERVLNARPHVHPEGSNAMRRNNAINARFERNLARRNQEIRRHEANLVALRRRLLGRRTHMRNQNILVGVNYTGRKADINRVQMKRLARLITEAYVKPGGMYSRNTVSNVKRVANSKRN